MSGTRIVRFTVCLATLCLCALAGAALAQGPAFDAALRDRIDAFVESERQASGIPGVALAIVQLGSPAHVRGFGDDGHGSIEEISRGLSALSLNRPVGERFEYSNLNFVLLGA
ncbi:MAG: hypothetical protein ACKVQA_06400, partial [Burkholderiales bacterium]